jgi:hypothetical protein
MVRISRRSLGWTIAFALECAPPAIAQNSDATSFAAPAPMAMSAAELQHVHATVGAGWRFMQDGILYAEFNHQGSPRGGDEFVVPTWWMGVASRNTSRSSLTLTSMLSLDPALVSEDGYREIFQVGETLNGQPLIDRQHPHDLFMQLAAAWRISLTNSTGLTVAGAAVGEPAVGPVAFMHRASAADNPTAPLGHHTLDSTHIAFGVATAAVDHGRWTVEGSLFNGREPDENRWDFDFGRLDSYSGRVWFRPSAEWEVQVSAAHLTEPEQLEPGDITRTTASAAWTRTSGAGMSAFTVAYGRNDANDGARNAVLLEGARRSGSNTLYSRLEVVQVETSLLLSDPDPQVEPVGANDPVIALTVGGVRDIRRVAGLDIGLGGDLTAYGVPAVLRPTYGSRPFSFHVFVRVQPSGPNGRMWNMRMAAPMGHVDHAPSGQTP